MNFLNNLINHIQKNLFQWIVTVIILGLFQVSINKGIEFTPLICLLAAFIMIYPSLVPLSFGKLKKITENYQLIFISILLNFILAPFFAWLLGYFFLKEYPVLWLGLFLISILPGGGMVTTWALRSKSDMPATVSIIIFNLLLAILIVPWGLTKVIDYLNLETVNASKQCSIETISLGVLSCGGGEINYQTVAISMLFIIVIPLILAYFTQFFLKKNSQYSKIQNFFGKISNLGLLIVLYFLMSLKNNAIIFDSPFLITKILFPLILFYLLNWIAIWIIHKRYFFNSKGRALVWGSYLKYITLALGLAISLIYQNESLSLIVIVIVLSYFIQIPTAFWLADYWRQSNKEKHNFNL